MRQLVNEELIGAGPYHYLTGLPYNEIFNVEFSRKTFALNRLPADWDGLTILHLSDFHFQGH